MEIKRGHYIKSRYIIRENVLGYDHNGTAIRSYRVWDDISRCFAHPESLNYKNSMFICNCLNIDDGIYLSQILSYCE